MNPSTLDTVTALAAIMLRGDITLSDDELAAARDVAVQMWEPAPGHVSLRAVARPLSTDLSSTTGVTP